MRKVLHDSFQAGKGKGMITMNMEKIKRAKQLAKEFINAANDVEIETGRLSPESGQSSFSWKSGLLRHWSVILSMALADMRGK